MRLRTLGGAALVGTSFHRTKSLLLLAYLAVEGARERQHLRELFWPDAADPASSLRVVASQLRRADPDLLREEGTKLSLGVPSDVGELLAAFRDAPDRVSGLYTGAFLDGLSLPDWGAELEEWVSVTREHLALEVQRHLLIQSEQVRSVSGVQRLLEQCLQLPGAAPLEAEMLQRMLALAPPGSQVEHAIRDELQELDPVLLTGQDPPASRLLGRDWMLAGLLALLAAGEPLIEITGPGGIGKTSLLRALLQEFGPVQGRQVVIADLGDLLSSVEVAARLTTALGVQLPAGAEAWTALGTALAQSRCLIALDGAEHLNDLAVGVEHLLERAPQVQVVVSSQRRLMRRGAHRALDGLDVPAPESDAALIQQAAGVRLFLQAASQVVQPPLSEEMELRMVAAIVRRLDGHPLAIRLAARELTAKTVAALHQQVLHDRLSVAPALQPLYSRTRSLLSEAGRRTLSRLAVLPTMRLADALQITEAGASEAEELQASSFLQVQEGRAQVTPVLKELAAADLPPADPVRARHAETFLARLTEWTPTDERAGRERANIVQAIQTRLADGSAEVAQVEWLMAHFEQRGLLAVGLETLGRLARFATSVPPTVQAALQVARAWLAFRSALFRDAEGHARALISGTDPATRDAQMKGFNILYAVLIQQHGRTAEAIVVLRRAIALAQELGSEKQEAMYQGNLCAALIHQGDYATARLALNAAKQLRATQPPGPEDARNWCRELSLRYDSGEADGPTVASARCMLSDLPRLQAEGMAGELLTVLGKAAVRAGQTEQLAQAALELESFLHDFPSPVMHIASALLQAEAAFAQQNTVLARTHLLHAASLCLEHDERTGALEVLLLAAQDLQWHDPELARQIASAVLSSPAASAIERREAARLGGQESVKDQCSTQSWLEAIQQLYEESSPAIASVNLRGR